MPELKFLDKYNDENKPPNDIDVFYSKLKNDGMPRADAIKYVARFYGTFDDKPFTSDSLHAHRGTKEERPPIPIEAVLSVIKKQQKQFEENKKKIDPIYEEAKLERKKGNIERANELKLQADLMKYLNEELLDKPRSEYNTGTDTFRDAIAIHDAPHSAALLISEKEKDNLRPKEERERAFAIHNIVGFQFPYDVEYVKYLTTQIDDFPLVITSLTKNTEELLSKKWLPVASGGERRWCTGTWKKGESEKFYLSYGLDGITQKLGNSRFQSTKRANQDPTIAISKLLGMIESKKTYNKGTYYTVDGEKITKKMNYTGEKILFDGTREMAEKIISGLPTKDVEDNDMWYSIYNKKESLERALADAKKGLSKKNNTADRIESLTEQKEEAEKGLKNITEKDITTFKITTHLPNPISRTYQTIPNFDMSETEQKKLMKKYNVKISPIVEKMDFHGCMMCPYRNAQYYQTLREEHPELYEVVSEWRRIGGTKITKKGKKKDYYYFHNPKLGDYETQFKKRPNNYYRIDENKPATNDNLRPIL